MTRHPCDICNILETEPTNLVESKYWRVNLATDQAYLGRCYVTLKSHKPSLSSLSPAEWTDLQQLIQALESACKKMFGATVFNWSCLTNNAFQVPPHNPHVHWHFRPRYTAAVAFAGITFVDPEFGHHYDSARKMPITPEVLRKICDALRQYL